MNALSFQQFCAALVPQSNRRMSSSCSSPTLIIGSSSLSNGLSFLSALSYDSILAVLSFLSVRDLGRLSQVSREARSYGEDDYIWRTLCKGLEQTWSSVLHRPIDMVPKIFARSGEWKRMYRIETQRIALCSRFVGLWSEKWCDVNVQQSTLIESDGRGWCVTYKKNKFSAAFRDYDPITDTLAFHLEGGDSGWSFVYKIRPIADHHCQLTVHRMHDQKVFSGDLFRCTPENTTGRKLDNAMGMHIQ